MNWTNFWLKRIKAAYSTQEKMYAEQEYAKAVLAWKEECKLKPKRSREEIKKERLEKRIQYLKEEKQDKLLRLEQRRSKAALRAKKHRTTLKSATRCSELRMTVLQHYSPGRVRCVCCHEDQIEMLTLDHMHQDGAEHRKELSGKNIYKWIVDNYFPEGFQVLCYNCNIGRYKTGGECPHSKYRTQ